MLIHDVMPLIQLHGPPVTLADHLLLIYLRNTAPSFFQGLMDTPKAFFLKQPPEQRGTRKPVFSQSLIHSYLSLYRKILTDSFKGMAYRKKSVNKDAFNMELQSVFAMIC